MNQPYPDSKPGCFCARHVHCRAGISYSVASCCTDKASGKWTRSFLDVEGMDRCWVPEGGVSQPLIEVRLSRPRSIGLEPPAGGGGMPVVLFGSQFDVFARRFHLVWSADMLWRPRHEASATRAEGSSDIMPSPTWNSSNTRSRSEEAHMMAGWVSEKQNMCESRTCLSASVGS